MVLIPLPMPAAPSHTQQVPIVRAVVLRVALGLGVALAPGVGFGQTSLQPAPPVQTVPPLGASPLPPPVVVAPAQPAPPLAVPVPCALKDPQARARCLASSREIRPVTPSTQPRGVTR